MKSVKFLFLLLGLIVGTETAPATSTDESPTSASWATSTDSTTSVHTGMEIATTTSTDQPTTSANSATSSDGTTSVYTVPACNLKADIVIIIDESGSIGSANFDLLKDFAQNLVTSIDSMGGVGLATNRIAVMFFSSTVSIRLYLDECQNSMQVNTVIGGETYSGGSTALTQALMKCRTEVLIDARGHRPHHIAPDIVVVLTDGVATDGDPIPEAAALKQHGAKIITVGIGSNINADQLNQISTSGTYIPAANFQELSSTLPQLLQASCGTETVAATSTDEPTTSASWATSTTSADSTTSMCTETCSLSTVAPTTEDNLTTQPSETCHECKPVRTFVQPRRIFPYLSTCKPLNGATYHYCKGYCLTATWINPDTGLFTPTSYKICKPTPSAIGTIWVKYSCSCLIHGCTSEWREVMTTTECECL